MNPIIYKRTSGFEKDLKRLRKKFRTLEDDIDVVKKNAIELFHVRKIDNHSVELMPLFCSDELKICKIKKFACKALKGRGVQSGIRIIYAFPHSTSKCNTLRPIGFRRSKILEALHGTMIHPILNRP